MPDHFAGHQRICLRKSSQTKVRLEQVTFMELVIYNILYKIFEKKKKKKKGGVLYEFIVGKPPYYDYDLMKMYRSIEEGKLTFPDTISSKAKKLLKAMN